MIGIFYIISTVVNLFLAVLQVLMLFRALISWLPIEEDSNIANFLYVMTEPVILPVRMLIGRIGVLSELPIDISFIVSFMLLSIIQMLLPTIA